MIPMAVEWMRIAGWVVGAVVIAIDLLVTIVGIRVGIGVWRAIRNRRQMKKRIEEVIGR